VRLPLDGNPNCAAGVIAHATTVADAAVLADGSHVVTVGGEEATDCVWRVRRSAIAIAASAGGIGAAPFRALLPGGADGPFYQELCDLFAYAQIRAEGEDATQSRRAGDHVPQRMLPELMRALGFYPTEFEASVMLSEVRAAAAAARNSGLWSRAVRGAVGVDEAEPSADSDNGTVTLAAVVRLFVNHKPALGVGREAIEEAMRVIAASRGKPGGKLPWRDLVAELRRRGEPLSRKEVDACLQALIGPEGHRPDNDTVVDADFLIRQVLGFVQDD
jgi:hypothetical protein